jgi:hypothetical protein
LTLTRSKQTKIYKFKNMKKNLVKPFMLALSVAGIINKADAQVDYTIANASDSATTSGYQYLESVDVSFSSDNGFSGDVFAGGIYITQSGNNPTMPQSYLTVCTDFEGSLYLGKTYQYSAPGTSFSTVLSQTGGGGIAPAWTNPSEAIQNAAKIFNTYGDISSTGISTQLSAVQMSALQVAIWIALYDTESNGSINLSGPFQFIAGGTTDGSAIQTDINTYLSGLTGNYSYSGSLLQPDPLNSTQGNSDGSLPQELLIGCVPEPSTVLAGAMLLLPLGASTIRILRKSRK